MSAAFRFAARELKPAQPVLEGAGNAEMMFMPLGELNEAASALQGFKLGEHLSQLEQYGTAAAKELENGAIRYYGKLVKAEKEGEMIGRRLVREWNPATGAKRTWHETLDANGTVRIVRPITTGDKIHYFFDAAGKYLGKW